jgi:small-conductance mechanosensitive channel
MTVAFLGRRRLSWGFVFVLLSALGAQAHAQQPGEAIRETIPITAPAALTRVLAAGTAKTEKEIGALSGRLAKARQALAQAEKDQKDLRIAVAAVKATLAVETPGISQIELVLETFSNWQEKLKAEAKEVPQAIAALQKEKAAKQAAQSTLREQMVVLQAAGQAAVLAPETQRAYRQYLKATAAEDRLMDQVLAALQQRWEIIQEEQALLASLAPQMQKLGETWKAQLLEIKPQLSLTEQVAHIWPRIAALPWLGWKWLEDLVVSGRLRAFATQHLAPLFGLLGLLLIISWGSRRLKRLATPRLREWQTQAENLSSRSLVELGYICLSYIFAIALVLWLGFTFGILGLLVSVPALIFLYFLAALMVLRLGLQVVQALFAGKEAGGVLPLDGSTARFYRRSLKLFLVYFILGILGLKLARLLKFPDSSYEFLLHLFELGLLLLGLWLGRRRYLQKVLFESGLTWLHKPMRILKIPILLFAVIIVFADLLGFQNLAVYVAEGAALTMGISILTSLVIFLVREGLRFLLHPETGWVPRRQRKNYEVVQRFYGMTQGLVGMLLGIAGLVWILQVWGIGPGRVAAAFAWVAMGPTLGPMKLTPLNIVAAALALYVGVWCGRLVNTLLYIRIYPRTSWDSGIQYTLSTTLRYVILVVAILIALNIMGFPLTNLALVAGALGVGIGFGLQNIVNNFISGLILLFERPIKVGDMLVIDNQWGIVKEIRMRSTIFETFDRYVLIIPNSELIAAKVLNWTHYGKGINRLTLKIGVGYHADPRQVTGIITQVCRANPRVIPEPEPQIYFSAYGDSSLDFTIWVYLATPDDRIPATHELNSAMLAALQQHGIEVPLPQRDLHIKDWPEPAEKKESQPGPGEEGQGEAAPAPSLAKSHRKSAS